MFSKNPDIVVLIADIGSVSLLVLKLLFTSELEYTIKVDDVNQTRSVYGRSKKCIQNFNRKVQKENLPWDINE